MPKVPFKPQQQQQRSCHSRFSHATSRALFNFKLNDIAMSEENLQSTSAEQPPHLKQPAPSFSNLLDSFKTYFDDKLTSFKQDQSSGQEKTTQLKPIIPNFKFKGNKKTVEI